MNTKNIILVIVLVVIVLAVIVIANTLRSPGLPDDGAMQESDSVESIEQDIQMLDELDEEIFQDLEMELEDIDLEVEEL
jgi:hypothetical protein